MSNDEKLAFEFYVLYRTPKAILCSDEKESGKGKEVWLPLSQIEFNEDPNSETQLVEVPEWLATTKELI